ncbi:CDP-glycerol glycerophosphotransferase family protein [Chromobacterium vaccinii]|uniref:CDP-glycerol glycerophosphotransferase family protein n=1 Tax=Chromobacterium vaccinii TaxID=1108595 RepID=UPI001E348547|nr:CDP-glycerol glycerophosphotransferase family protein [Chromobacterium vaccinii]MCD4483021.1 CDP-glycerol glycerophosphotransferase family protein [Chromobacterium vaccinii]
MSKIKKLIRTPGIFFADMAIKRGYGKTVAFSHNTSQVINPKEESASSKPPVKKIPQKNTATTETLNTDAINFFMPASVLLHTGEGEASGSAHLSMWIPYFSGSGCQFTILVRNIGLYSWVRKNYPLIPVAYAKNPIDVETVINRLPSLQACFYPSNTGNNIHLLRFNHIEHVFIGHGDSDKSASAHKFFRVYDKIWVAGQAHIDRFNNSSFCTRHLEFIKIGRPNLKDILLRSENPWHERSSFISILYLPTWEGVFEEQNYSSTKISGEIIRKVKENFKVEVNVKFHPMTGNRDKTLVNIREDLGKALVQIGLPINIEQRLTPIHELLKKTNVFICDISAVVSECLSADGPIFVFIPQDREIKLSQSDMPYDYYSYTFSSPSELIEKMGRVLAGDDYLSDKRREAIDYLIGRSQTLESEFSRQLSLYKQ